MLCGNRDLHITSHNFDEPQCVGLIRDCAIVVAIHGREDKADADRIYLGGLNSELKQLLGANLNEAGFSIQMSGHPFPATHPSNVCNRGRSGRGVQMELPRSLRDQLAADPSYLQHFADAVRASFHL
jgi:phage replication-related protein YjqB (UPF0714/DUF867 family)